MKRKLIFLDIDGVLNSRNYFKKFAEEYKRKAKRGEVNFERAEQIDPDCIIKLNTIIEQTQAEIIISSSWRFNCSVELIYDYMKVRGYTGKAPIGKIPSLRYADNFPGFVPRGCEIHEWLLLHASKDFKDYVIFDDDDDMLFWQKDNFIQTGRDTGLSDHDVEKAIQILNRKKRG